MSWVVVQIGVVPAFLLGVATAQRVVGMLPLLGDWGWWWWRLAGLLGGRAQAGACSRSRLLFFPLLCRHQQCARDPTTTLWWCASAACWLRGVCCTYRTSAARAGWVAWLLWPVHLASPLPLLNLYVCTHPAPARRLHTVGQ